MEREFKTALTRSGNVINPDVITVTDKSVTWKKRKAYLIGSDTTEIPIEKVSTVELHNKGFGTDVKIGSYGFDTIYAKNLTYSDAKELKALIFELQSNRKSPVIESHNPETPPVIMQKEESEVEKLAKQYRNHKLIPLLKLGDDPSTVNSQLEIIVQYAHIMPWNDTYSGEVMEAYADKLKEGIRILKRVGNSGEDVAHWESELARIEDNLRGFYKAKKKDETKEKRSIRFGMGCSIFFWLIIVFVIILIIYAIAGR